MGKLRGPSLLKGALLLSIAALGAGLLFFAARLTLDYFDAYESLLNARALALGAPEIVYGRRFYLPSALYSPLFLLERWTGAPLLAFRAAHVLSVLFYLGTLAFVYRLARLRFAKEMVFIGTALLAINPVMLQMAPFAKEDMPALFFLTGTAYFILQCAWRARRSTYFWMTAFATAAVACRYNVLAIVFLLYFAAAAKADGPARKKMLASFLTAVALFVLGGVLFYWCVERTPLAVAGSSFFASFWEQYALKLGQKEPASENLWMLGRSVGWPLLAVFLLGLAARWKKGRDDTFFFALWIFPMLLVQSFFVGGKEARYLLPFFPAIYLLIGDGLAAIAAWLRARLRPALAAAAGTIVVGALVFLPAAEGARSVLRYRDPAYFDPFAQKLSVRAARASQTRKILWCGMPYTVCPKDYLFDVRDEYTFLYQLYAHTVRFYAPQHEVSVWSHEVQDTRKLGIRGIPFMLRSTAGPAADGDGLIVHGAEFYQTKTVPTEMFPVWIARARAYDFSLKDPEGGENFEYRCPQLENALITLDRKAPDARFIALGMPVAPMNFYTDVPGKGVKMFQPLDYRLDGDSAINILAAMEDKLAPPTIRVVVCEIQDQMTPERGHR